jgi:hypothetical protein
MAVDDTDFLWNMYNEHTTQAKHHETQRTAIVTVVLALAGAVIAYLANVKTSAPLWPISAFLVVLGLFGAVFSLKQTERARMHTHIAGKYRRRLERCLDKNVARIGTAARTDHNEKWFWLTGRDDKNEYEWKRWRYKRKPRRKKQRAEKEESSIPPASTERVPVKEATAAATEREAEDQDQDREPMFHLYWFFIGLSALVTILGIVTWVSPIR